MWWEAFRLTNGNDATAVGNASGQALSYFAVVCWFTAAVFQFMYGLSSLVGLRLPSKLRHAAQLTKSRQVRVRELLSHQKNGRGSSDVEPVGRSGASTVLTIVVNPACQFRVLDDDRIEVTARVGDHIDVPTLFFLAKDDEPTTKDDDYGMIPFSMTRWFEYVMQPRWLQKDHHDVEEGVVAKEDEKTIEDDPPAAKESGVKQLKRNLSNGLCDLVYRSWLGSCGVGHPSPTNNESWDAWFLRSSRPPLISVPISSLNFYPSLDFIFIF